jgi:CBS domain-containing protein
MGAPLMAVVFAVELTGDMNMLLPLLAVAMVAYAFSVLAMKRSILTERIHRRGFHLSREYAPDPLETMAVKEVMRREVAVIVESHPVSVAAEALAKDTAEDGPGLFPVVNEAGDLRAVFNRTELRILMEKHRETSDLPMAELCDPDPRLVVAYPDEPLRAVAYRMAETGRTRLPVLERRSGERGKENGRCAAPSQPRLVGMIVLADLLKARVVNLQAENRRERVIPLPLESRFRDRDAG